MTENPSSRPPVPAHGGQLRAIARQFGAPAEKLLDFSVNINPDGPPPSVINVLRGALSDAESLTAYPDADYELLKQAIGARLQVPTKCVLVANGFVPLLQAALKVLGAQCCVLPVPAFSEYRRSLEQAGMEVISCPLEPLGFQYAPDVLLTQLRQQGAVHRHCLLLIANPQNPSGALASADLLLHLVDDAARYGVTVLLDEAFIDYAPAQSLGQHAASLPNLIVFRSLTKFFSIPALRVAYAISAAELAGQIASALPPWPVGTLAAEAGTAAIAELSFATQSQEANARRQHELACALAKLGLSTYPSHTNFLLLKLPQNLDAGAVWRDLIVEHHVLTRSCSNFESLSAPHLRVAVRTSEENDRLVAALAQVLSQAAH